VGKWFLASREYTNYTYALSDENIEDLVDFVSVVSGKPPATVADFISEIQRDTDLREHIESSTRDLPFSAGADKTVQFSRRMGWYALIRATKPKLVVETGTDKGLGSCVIAAALMKNNAEGDSGKLMAIDINPEAGGLVSGKYADFVEQIYDDSLAALSRVSSEIDLFIHDSDHSLTHEAAEYDQIVELLSETSIVISDNAHV